MNNYIITILLAILLLFHRSVRHFMTTGKVKEAFCALWLVDTIFITCSVLISFVLYNYSLTAWFDWQMPIFVILYVIAIVIFLLITPSGLQVLKKTFLDTPNALLQAEYRFNDTLGLVRNFFMTLLFVLPIALEILSIFPRPAAEVLLWSKTEVCSAVYFVIFLILLPLCLRQALFWLKNLQTPPTETEEILLRNYRTQLRFKKRNYRF